MLEQLSAEYVTTARVKGMSEWAVIWRHAFKNIRVQLITVIALSYANLLEGSVLDRDHLLWPGIGSYITTALLVADMNAVLGGTVVVGLIFILLNIFSDLLYKVFDPEGKMIELAIRRHQRWREWLLTEAPTSRRHAKLRRSVSGWLAFRSIRWRWSGLGILVALFWWPSAPRCCPA